MMSAVYTDPNRGHCSHLRRSRTDPLNGLWRLLCYCGVNVLDTWVSKREPSTKKSNNQEAGEQQLKHWRCRRRLAVTVTAKSSLADHFRSIQIGSDRFWSLQIKSDPFSSFQINLDHFWSLLVTSNHLRSLQITSVCFRSIYATSNHLRSLQISTDHFCSLHFRSIQVTSNHSSTLQTNSGNCRSLQITSVCFRSILITFDRLRSLFHLPHARPSPPASESVPRPCQHLSVNVSRRRLLEPSCLRAPRGGGHRGTVTSDLVRPNVCSCYSACLPVSPHYIFLSDRPPRC